LLHAAAQTTVLLSSTIATTAETNFYTPRCNDKQERLLQNIVQLQPKGSCQEVKGSSTALKGTWPSSKGQLQVAKGSRVAVQKGHLMVRS